MKVDREIKFSLSFANHFIFQFKLLTSVSYLINLLLPWEISNSDPPQSATPIVSASFHDLIYINLPFSKRGFNLKNPLSVFA